MILLKYRCEKCSKTFFVPKEETPGQTKMACPHCSNAFEGVSIGWLDDEIVVLSTEERSDDKNQAKST